MVVPVAWRWAGGRWEWATCALGGEGGQRGRLSAAACKRSHRRRAPMWHAPPASGYHSNTTCRGRPGRPTHPHVQAHRTPSPRVPHRTLLSTRTCGVRRVPSPGLPPYPSVRPQPHLLTHTAPHTLAPGHKPPTGCQEGDAPGPAVFADIEFWRVWAHPTVSLLSQISPFQHKNSEPEARGSGHPPALSSARCWSPEAVLTWWCQWHGVGPVGAGNGPPVCRVAVCSGGDGARVTLI